MAKFGCTTIVIVLMLLVFAGWYKVSYLPERISERIIALSEQNSSKFIDCSAQDLARLTNMDYRDKPGLFCRVQKLEDTVVEVCTNSTGNHREGIKNPLKESQSKITITLSKKKAPITFFIDHGDFAGIDCGSVASSEKYIFVSWRHRNPTTTIYSLNIKVISKETGQEVIERMVLRKGFGIENPAIGYHQKTDSLLFAWNDYNFESSRDLFLGNISVDRLLDSKAHIAYRQVLTEDQWDKRNPYFLKDGNRLYFAHSTGDHWGIASHSGKPGIGVSLINDVFSPTEYSVIKAKTSAGKIVKIHDAILYYTKLSSNGSKIEEIRSIPFSKTFKHAAIR